MKGHPGRRAFWIPRLAAGGLVAACVLLSASVAPADADYVQEDVRISGRTIHAFDDDGRTVSVVLGDFRMTIGERVLSGRDAVIWVRRRLLGKIVRREITVYIEGDAKVVEGGTTTTDKVMLVTVRHQGGLSAEGAFSDRPLKEFPLYRRALSVRAAATQPATQPATRPAIGLVPGVRPAPQPRPRPVPVKPVAPAVEKPPPPQPVLSADGFSSQWVGEGADRRRVTIARGNVYISQSTPGEKDVLELRSQSAVIFTKEMKKPSDPSRAPYRPRIEGLDTGGEEKERIVGVYLDGDVRISRGERSMRGPMAYYDFVTNKAILPDAVFRIIQKQRNIPIIVRAEEARALSVREMWFKNARISTSEFYTPTYHIGARTAYLVDMAEYDEKQVRITPQRWRAKTRSATFNIRGLPVLWVPRTDGDFEQGHTALRKLHLGKHGQKGWGVESEWHLFRLLGLIGPEDFNGRVDLNQTQQGSEVGAKLWYARRNYSGYSILHGIVDQEAEDDFGDERKNVDANRTRGRVLIRHKHLAPKDWRIQFELSYYCDRNYIERFYPDEFHAGKPQETLIYAKKQRDNWAFTTLLQARMNRFQTQTESAPDMGFHLIGQPLLGDRLTFFHESHLGAKRWRTDDAARDVLGSDTSFFARADTRNEINWPIRMGMFNFVPYATGRATHWGDSPPDGEECRLYGQIGVRANTRFWRVYPNVRSRLFDVHGLRHIITPEATAFLADSPDVAPRELYPMDPDIEMHLRRQSGVAVGLRQRLQTKRGPAGNRRTADWMRFDLSLGVYSNGPDLQPADGKFFFYRPEYSLGRNHLNAEYTWNISDSMLLMADANYDLDTGRVRRQNIGLAVRRDPRLRYYVGLRKILDMDSMVGTLGLSYKLSRKYSVSFFEQYDFDFDDGKNLSTSVTITRKLPRWYAAFTFGYNQADDEVTLLVSFWPEGVSEARIGTGRMSLLSGSDEN